MTTITYTVEEAARALRISRGYLYRDITAGRLRTYQIGRRRYVSAEALQEYIRQREAEAQLLPVVRSRAPG